MNHISALFQIHPRQQKQPYSEDYSPALSEEGFQPRKPLLHNRSCLLLNEQRARCVGKSHETFKGQNAESKKPLYLLLLHVVANDLLLDVDNVLPFPNFDHIQGLQGRDNVFRFDACTTRNILDGDIMLHVMVLEQIE